MTPAARSSVREFLARLAIATLFTLLSVSIVNEFVRTRHLTGILLLSSEVLVVVLTIVRRPPVQVDGSAVAAAVTAVSVIGPPLVRPVDVPSLAPDIVTAIISVVGLVIVITGKLTLGRSFGLIPANRGVVSRGPYTLMRHPIYAGYLLTHAAFLVAHPSAWNVGLLIVADAALVYRALLEERVLVRDEAYRAYCARVSWHLVPGVF